MFQAVCASNGNVYASECEMLRQTCGERVVVTGPELCSTTRYSRVTDRDRLRVRG